MVNHDTQNKLKSFFSQSKNHEYKRGETVLHTDDEPQGVSFLEDGYVKMNTVFEDGRELTLNILKPGTFFPMTWALADIDNTFYFQTMTPVIIKRVAKKDFQDFINANPDVLMDFTTRILIGLNGILNNIQHLLSGDSYHRVVAAVLLSAKRFGKPISDNQISVQLPLTHQDIADIAGITRETASIAISKLIKSGLISHHYRKMTILKLSKLEAQLSINGEDHQDSSAV